MTKSIPADDEEAILARAREIDADRARIAAEECVTLYKPLLDLLASDAWNEVRTKAEAIAPPLLTNQRAYFALTNLAGQMAQVAGAVPAQAHPVPAAG